MIPGLGRSPGEGNGYPLQYSCVENSMDRGAWQATTVPGGHKELDMTERLILSLIRVLGKVEKINFIALPVTGGHNRLLPSKLCSNLGGGGGG